MDHITNTTGRGSVMGARTPWRITTRLGLVAVLVASLGLLSRADTTPPVDGALALVADADTVKQTEVEAVAAARRNGRQTEIAAFRGERRDVWANPDGSFTETHHQRPVRTVRRGKWVPINPTLVRHGDGSVTPQAAAVGLRLSGGGTGPLATLQRAGRTLSLSWPRPLPVPALTADTATYAEVLAGVDLVVHANATGFSHVLVVKNAAAAAQPQIADLALGLKTTGLAVKPDAAGGVSAVDTATGGTVFDAPTPTMWDAGDPAEGKALMRATGERPTRAAPDSARRAPLKVRVERGKLHLTPDKAMLADPNLRYPVMIDPYWQGTSRSAWTMVDSGYPSEEYWKFDGESHERIAYCPIHEGWCNNSRVKRLLYALPTPYQDDRITILSAQFRVTMQHTYDGTARGVSLYRMSGGITSATNWTNQPAWSVKQQSVAPTATQSSCSATNQNVEFNATAAVQEAAKYNWASTTFGIKSDNETDYHWVKHFCDNAVLKVHYNRNPLRPAASELSLNPGGRCVYGAAAPYVSSLPRLNAILRDPDTGDAEPLTAQFRVSWTPAGGTLQTKTWTHTSAKNSGSTFSYNLADATSGTPSLPENVVVSWDVRASDGTAWGRWSSDGAANPCQFFLDKTKPAGPDIDSPEYLPSDAADNGTATAPECVEDEQWRDGVGRYGTFTFDSSATDVIKYEYGFDTDPSPANVLTPAADGGPVTVRWLAAAEKAVSVYVRAVDRAGKTSDTSVCTFRVAAGAPAVGAWSMADPAGATAAADAHGSNHATAGHGATFAVEGPGGKADRAVHLTGADDSYLATASRALINTQATFAISAWVRLSDDTSNHVAVSQNGTGEPGFTLGFDAATKKWAFTIPVTDVESLGSWQVFGAAAVKNEWTHLVGTYDAQSRTMALHVNGGAPATAARRSAWTSRGAVQIGRRVARSGYTSHWRGDIAEVTVFNRLVMPSEITQMAALVPVRRAYWELDGATPRAADPTVLISSEHTGDDTKDLALHNGATVYTPDPEAFPPEQALVGAGHLVLDGADDYAASAAAIAQTDRSFSVTARVRLASDCTENMAVLSQPGAHTSGFVVRCSAGGGAPRWEVAMPHSDAAGAPATTTVFDDQRLPNTDIAGQHLALVYNAYLDHLRLYIDGQLAATADGAHANAWSATAAGIQVGRTKHNDAWNDYFAGAIDDVRVYAGVLDDTTVQRLTNPEEQSDL